MVERTLSEALSSSTLSEWVVDGMAEVGWPEEGEFLVCTVKRVRENGAYLTLDGYDDREGFVFIGEIASGWVRNIRNHIREGQRVVAKSLKVRRDRKSVELSIKMVSEERRRDTLQLWKNEQRANQLLRIVGERSNWRDDEIATYTNDLTESFGTLYGAFEEAAINDQALGDAGFSGDWMAVLVDLAAENIVPPFITIRGAFEIEVWGVEGVDGIRTALLAAEEHSDPEAEVEVDCYYDGAPRYRVEVKAPDYRTGQSAWDAAVAAAESVIADVGGSFAASTE